VFTFGEIRAFTGEEIGRMNSEMERIDALLARERSDVSSLSWNPLNYVLGPQRDNVNRLQGVVAQHERVRAQLMDSISSTIESGDTAKLSRWFGLAASVNAGGWDAAVRDAAVSTAVVGTAKDTAATVAKGFKFGLPLVAVGVALYLLAPLLLAASRRK
jgi:hypothetical protein